jgi:hypothetical protein
MIKKSSMLLVSLIGIRLVRAGPYTTIYNRFNRWSRRGMTA